MSRVDLELLSSSHGVGSDSGTGSDGDIYHDPGTLPTAMHSANSSMAHTSETFIAEVDATKGTTSVRGFSCFEELLLHVSGLMKLHSSSPDPMLPYTAPAGPAADSCQGQLGLLGAGHMAESGRMSLDAFDNLEMNVMVEEPALDIPTNGFTWVNLQTTKAGDINRIGRVCNLHSLTIDDITNDVYEKAEMFVRRGYMYCMLDSEDMRGNPAHIHVLLFRGWVLTIHNHDCAAIHETLRRLQEQFEGDIDSLSGGSLDAQAHQVANNFLAHASWVLYTLADLDVDWMVETADMVLQEARETDEVMLATSSKELSDVLRRISVARSRIHAQRQRAFSKQRLLMSCSSSATEAFIAPQLKMYLRDVYDHIQWCSQRLHSADDVLTQANSNYLACISIEASHTANRMNVILGRFTLLTVAFTPFNVAVGLFGMNVQVPMRDVPGLGPWGAITFTGIVVCTAIFLVLYRLDQQQNEK